MPLASSSRIAVCSWSLRPSDPADLVRKLQRLDIHSIQLALNPLLHDPANWGRAIDELRSAGIWISSGMLAMIGEDYSTLDSIARTGGVRPDATWFANRDLARNIAELASRAGISLITAHAGFIPNDRSSPERAKILDRLRILADLFHGHQIALALETGQEHASTLAVVLDELQLSHLGVNFDPANMILYGSGDPIQSLQLLAPHVRQVHIKDALPAHEPGTWGREAPVGQGAVDWPKFFEIALAIHPPVQFVIEREARTFHETDIAAARNLVAHHLRIPIP